MPNPLLFLCDTDVLTQFFLADEIRPLRELKNAYGIQPAIVEEVNIELRWMRKFGGQRFVAQLDKAIKSEIIKVIDQRYFQSLLGAAPEGASWQSFQNLGTQYYRHVQRG